MRHFARPANAFLQEDREPRMEGGAAFHVLQFLQDSPEPASATPAIEAGAKSELWELEDIIQLIDATAPLPNHPRQYKKRNSSRLTPPSQRPSSLHEANARKTKTSMNAQAGAIGWRLESTIRNAFRCSSPIQPRPFAIRPARTDRTSGTPPS